MKRILLVALVLGACGAPEVETPATGTLADRLYRPPVREDFETNPGLLDRVAESPYGYFRFVNHRFAAAVCELLPEVVAGMPTVNLHGDAHLEQYAVTNVGHGLSDFDDACSGPGAIDLVRFLASLHLACELRGWSEEAPRLADVFLESYELGLEDPAARALVPDFVERVLQGFPRSRVPFLTFVQSILEPLEPGDRSLLTEGYARYVELMLEKHPHLPRDFFGVVSLGRVRIGVGSALDRKYLVRVRGASDAEEDDVVLEIRQVRDLGDIPCIRGGEGRSAFRVLLGYSRIGAVPFDFVGPIPPGDGDALGGAEYWVHAWQAHYHELDVETDDFDRRDLEQIVRDAGLQLGVGHTARIGDPLRLALRRYQSSCLRRCRTDVLDLSRDMAEATVEAWRRFRVEAAGLGLELMPVDESAGNL